MDKDELRELIEECCDDIFYRREPLANVKSRLSYTLEEQLHTEDIIKRIEKYAPSPVELPEFDLTKKEDHVYCVEWGMKKAERNKFEVYQKMLKELKDKYVL